LSGDELIRIVPVLKGCESSRHLFQIRISNRDQVLMALNEYEIFPGVHYRDNTEYRMYSIGANTCPEAHLASKEIISLPMHMGVAAKDIEYITGTLSKVVRAAR